MATVADLALKMQLETILVDVKKLLQDANFVRHEDEHPASGEEFVYAKEEAFVQFLVRCMATDSVAPRRVHRDDVERPGREFRGYLKHVRIEHANTVRNAGGGDVVLRAANRICGNFHSECFAATQCVLNRDGTAARHDVEIPRFACRSGDVVQHNGQWGVQPAGNVAHAPTPRR